MHAAAGSETHGLPAELHYIDPGIYMKPRMNVFGLDRAKFDVRLGHYWCYCTFYRRVLDRLGSLSRAVTCSLPPSSYLHTLLKDPLAVSKNILQAKANSISCLRDMLNLSSHSTFYHLPISSKQVLAKYPAREMSGLGTRHLRLLV